MVNLGATVRRLALLSVVSQELNGSLAAGFTHLECVSTFEGPHVHRYTRPVVLGNHHYIATRRCTMAQWPRRKKRSVQSEAFPLLCANNKNTMTQWHSTKKYTRIIQHYVTMIHRLLSQPPHSNSSASCHCQIHSEDKILSIPLARPCLTKLGSPIWQVPNCWENLE